MITTTGVPDPSNPNPVTLFKLNKLSNGKYTIQSDDGRYWTRYHLKNGKTKQVAASYYAGTDRIAGHFDIEQISGEIKNGFTVLINGVQCLQAGDFGDNVDELYIEVFVDGEFKEKIGPRTMNPTPFLLGSKQEYWMMPGSYYAEDNVRFDLWEEDSGKNPAFGFDPDDKIGSITINADKEDGNYIAQNFESGGESGKWRIVCSKLTRTDYAPTNEIEAVKVTIPIKDQGNEGACVGYATTAALAMAYLKENALPSINYELFDGEALYRNRDSQTAGWEYASGSEGGSLNYLLKNPIPFKPTPGKALQLKSYFSYNNNGEVREYFLDNNSVSYLIVERADPGKGLQKMRDQIKNGNALLTRYDVFDDFNVYVRNDGLYGGRVSSTEPKLGGHAVLIIGYGNPSKGENGFPSWAIQNSWGPQWGMQGLCFFASGAVGIDNMVYKIGDFEVVETTSQPNSNVSVVRDMTYHFSNSSDWVVRFTVTYVIPGYLPSVWSSTDLKKGGEIELEIKDNYDIQSIKAEYIDLLSWKTITIQNYNKKAKDLPNEYLVKGSIGSLPTYGTK
ncbi:C1 family peptidase [Cyclobacterium xiamenense]|nr:C1 family peptidase [Cyclobacterium xiamenense]